MLLGCSQIQGSSPKRAAKSAPRQDSRRYFHAEEADTQSGKPRFFWSLENTSLIVPGGGPLSKHHHHLFHCMRFEAARRRITNLVGRAPESELLRDRPQGLGRRRSDRLALGRGRHRQVAARRSARRRGRERAAHAAALSILALSP
jgi:hypothetical protein